MDEPTLRSGLPEGGRAALALAAARHRSRLVAYADRVLKDRAEAEDVVQEAFMKASHAAGSFEVRNLAGWLYAAVHSGALDKMRERRLRPVPVSGADRPSGGPGPLGQALVVERREALAAALHALPEPYRTALVLRYVESCEFREVAARMDTIERTARTWVGRGLTELRRRLKEQP